MATSRRLIQSLAYVLVVLSPALGQTEHTERAMAEAPWVWAVPPRPVAVDLIRRYGAGFVVGEVACLLDVFRDGKLSLVCRYPQAPGAVENRYRAIVFDKSGRRYIIPEHIRIGETKGTLLALYIIDDAVNPDSVAFIGVEVLDASGWSQLSSSLADRDHGKGVKVLPFPALDRPYTFDLPTSDGKSISSAQLLGKVVIIDCWATPSLGNVASLKALYDEIGADRLAIVGVNFDPTEKQARWAIEETHMTWPQVLVMPDQERYAAWYDIATIRHLPRTFVLDQTGILRADITNAKNYDVVRSLVLPK